jgi:hypothetical protein
MLMPSSSKGFSRKEASVLMVVGWASGESQRTPESKKAKFQRAMGRLVYDFREMRLFYRKTPACVHCHFR